MSASSSASSSSSSTWYHAYLKLRFFTRIRRFLQNRASSNKRFGLSDMIKINDDTIQEPEAAEMEMEREIGDDCDGWMVVLQRAVKRLHFGSWEEKEAAAGEIKTLAAGEDHLKRRKMMAELGVIQPLVAMLGSEVVARRRLAIQALLELANGTCTNKALMVEAGILSKLPENIGVAEELAKCEFAQLVLSLSSLANAQFPINSSNVLPFVLHMIKSSSSIETKELCVGTLYNLSTMLDNAGALASSIEVVDILLRLSSIKEISEKALATLGNLVVTLMGKKALENNPLVPESLIEIMTWEEKPRSQELSAYVLMILAHQSSVQRQKMAKAGIVHVLLEVALLGSPLGQKRAFKLLQWFKDERQTRMGPHSGPQTRRLSIGSPARQEAASEGKKVMKRMVKQSLYKNMETITRRANGTDHLQDSNSKLKLLVISSSSKSLPY